VTTSGLLVLERVRGRRVQGGRPGAAMCWWSWDVLSLREAGSCMFCWDRERMTA
jgi:hypothetical protein